MPQGSFTGAGWGSRARIQLIENGTMTRLLVNGQLYMRWPSEDDLSTRLAIAQLSKLGFGTYEEIAKAFRIHEKSVYNYSHNKLEHGKLKVSLRRFRNNEIDYAARRLCEDLNAMVPRTLDKFQLPIIYEVL